MISRASADTALRPRAVSAPACGGAAGSCSVRHTAPLRADTRSPFRGARTRTRAPRRHRGACVARGRVRAAAPPRRRTPAAAARRTAAGAAASRSIAIAASTSPPFMSATPGPVQRSPVPPEPPPGGLPGGNTVSVMAEQRHGRAPSPASVSTRLRAGPSGSSTHVWCIRAARATRRSARPPPPARCRPTVSRCRPARCEPGAERVCRWGRGHRHSLPDGVWLRCRYGCRCSIGLHAGQWARRRGLSPEHGLERRRGGRREGGLRAAADPQGAGDRRPRGVQHRRGAGAGLRPSAATTCWDARAGAVSQEGRARAERRLRRLGRGRRCAGVARHADRRATAWSPQPTAEWRPEELGDGPDRGGHARGSATSSTADSMPAEAGLEDRAVSFTKGCYPGQEPVARLHYRGHANRGVRGLALAAVAARAGHHGRGRRPTWAG